MAIELSEQEQLRRQSLAALRELGIDPYPAARFDVTSTAREILDGPHGPHSGLHPPRRHLPRG